uniref:Bidirectional sugar transporter SWEET n=1 Tax=Peronospora matthiolae TaxID=2874970 RepID=A0AAV1TF28_9STRA
MVNVIIETLFRMCTSITSVSVTLSMVPSMYRIYCNKDTGVASVLLLVCMVANAHVWMLNGAIVENWFPMFATYLTSDVIAIGYVTVFCCFARDRKKSIYSVLIGATTLSLITAYAIAGHAGYTNQSKEGVDMTLGILGVTASLSMFCSPFERILKVLHYKSAAFIPIPMVATGALCNIMWIVYCPMAGRWFLFGGNATCLILCSVNIVLYIVYNPKTHPLHLEEGDPDAYQGELPKFELVSIFAMRSSLRSDGDVSWKAKQHLPSPAYSLVHSPAARNLSDISSRM